MRKSWLFIIPLLISGLFFSGCKKNTVEETFTPIINPVTPDFTTKVNAAVNGFITDENGNAVQDATIIAGTTTTSTDEFGYFKIDNAAFSKSVGFIQVSKAGYFNGYRSFLPTEGKQTFIRVKLLPKATAGTIESTTGGLVSSADGATVTLPANAVVTASNNTSYSGTVNVAVHWFDPSDMTTTSLTMPGDLTGVDSAGHLNVLQTFGMMAVELTGNSGELLQIAPGKKASLHFPLPSSLQAAAPSYIPLWYFDETKGVWKQEGHAIKNGNSYDGEVSHFSFWNCDWGLPLIVLKAQLVDTAVNPLCNVPITIHFGSQINSQRIVYTNANGFITEMIPANYTIDMEILNPCSQSVFSQNFNSANSDIDLGTITVNLGQFGGIVKGFVKKCNGNPVSDGFITGFLGPFSVAEIQNGYFSASGIICSSNTVHPIAIDRETMYQNSQQDFTIRAGINDLDTLTACTPAQQEYFSYTVDGVTNVFTPPQYKLDAGYDLALNTNRVQVVDVLNGVVQRVQLSYLGNPVTGDHQVSSFELGMPPNDYFFLDPVPSVTISNYGLIGQFIDGSFSGQAMDFSDNTVHTLSCSFHIQRDY